MILCLFFLFKAFAFVLFFMSAVAFGEFGAPGVAAREGKAVHYGYDHGGYEHGHEHGHEHHGHEHYHHEPHHEYHHVVHHPPPPPPKKHYKPGY